jgi:23S rRNA pseudouridine1911/1915/1917 synthase
MNILYEDKDILVVEKPAGIPVETNRIGSKDMVSLLKNHLAETGGKPGGIPYLGMIHRLDSPYRASWYSPKIRKPPLP